MTLIGNTKSNRKNKTVLLLKAEPFEKDTRVIKEIRTLYKAGFDVFLMTWGKHEDIPNSFKDINILRTTFNLPRPIGWLHIPLLPLWWFFIIIFSLNKKWDIVHVINIHSVIPGIIVSKIKRKPLIYEIEDVYEDFITIPFLRKLLLAIEKKIIKLTSAVIMVDDALIEQFSIGADINVVIIYDSPEDFNKSLVENPNRNNNFIIFYDGVLQRSRNLLLDKLFSAINKVNGVEIIICGGGDLVGEIQTWCRDYPQKFSYLGYIQYDELIRNSLNADLLPAIRSSYEMENFYNCGSKVLKSMMCGRPTLVNIGTSGERIVRKEQCGIIVDATDIDELAKAIELLKNDPVLCLNLGKNAREAYEKRYGWHIMETKLINLYDSLIFST